MKEKVFQTFLLRLLIKEEVNLISAEKKVEECLVKVEHRRERVHRLHNAIEALKGEPQSGR